MAEPEAGPAADRPVAAPDPAAQSSDRVRPTHPLRDHRGRHRGLRLKQAGSRRQSIDQRPRRIPLAPLGLSLFNAVLTALVARPTTRAICEIDLPRPACPVKFEVQLVRRFEAVVVGAAQNLE